MSFPCSRRWCAACSVGWRGREEDAAEDVGGEALLSFRLLEGLLPMERRELEHALPRPAGQQAEEIPQVGPGLEAVHLTAGQQVTRVAFTSAASSLPTKSQFVRPSTSRRRAFSLALLWPGRRPSLRKRLSAFRWFRALAPGVTPRH